MGNAIDLTRELKEILYKLGYWIENKNKKSFKVVSIENDVGWMAFCVSKILNDNINTYNVSNIMLGKNSLQDLYTYEITIQDNDTLIVNIFNLQSYKDRQKFKDIFELVKTAGDAL